MTKKKLFASVIAVMLVLYMMCLTLSLFSTKNYIEHDINTQINAAQASVSTLSQYESAQDVIDAIHSGPLSPYPMVYGVFDSDGNCVAREGSVAWDDDHQIYLDNYISAEIMDQILSLRTDDDDNKDIRVRRVSYCKKNGALIPVEVTFYYTNYDKASQDGENDLTLALTDNKATGTLAPLVGCSDISFSWADGTAANRYYYESQRALAYHFNTQSGVKEAVSEYMIEGSAGSGGGGTMEAPEGSDADCTYWFWDTLKIDGHSYLAYGMIAVNLTKTAWYSDFFRQSAFNLALVFMVMIIIMLIVANKLYKRQMAQEQSRRAFTGAVAHEMKTPLAIIQNQCECIEENIAPEKQPTYIASIREEAERMTGYVQTFLQYNRLNSAEHITKSDCDLSELTNKELDKYRPLIVERGISLVEQIQENVHISANEELLALAVDNYISNAVRYCRENGEMRITLKGDSFEIYNECEGIPEDAQKQIWDVLYREDASRTHSVSSTGMGLAICRRIFELSGYRYGCHNVESGVEFYFHF